MNIKKMLKKVDGWKTVLAYILIQIPWFSANPMVLDAAQKVLANTSDVQAWVNLIVQVLLAVGVLDIIRKNVVYGTARTGQTK